jgi:hypothetical protein
MGSGGGLVGRWDKGIGTGMQEVERWNTMADVSAGSSVSSHDGDDDDRETAGMKRRDKGKGKAQEVEQVKETDAKEEKEDYEWVIMQFGDDNCTSFSHIVHKCDLVVCSVRVTFLSSARSNSLLHPFLRTHQLVIFWPDRF